MNPRRRGSSCVLPGVRANPTQQQFMQLPPAPSEVLMKSIRYTLLLATLVLAPVTGLGSAAFAADAAESADPLTCTAEKPCLLRVRTVAPLKSPWGTLLNLLKKAVVKESKGRLKVKVHFGSKSEGSAVRQCLRGRIGGIGVSNGALSSAVPEFSATEMPFLFKNYKEADKAFSASEPLIREILKKRGFLYAVRGENGFRHFASKAGFLMTPADIAGKVMRSQPAKHHLAMYKALGATPKSITVAEVPTSLANGAVSGYDNTLLFADLAGWADEIKFVTKSAHIYQGAMVAWCKGWTDRLPDDLQAILAKPRPKLEKLGVKLVRVFNDTKAPKRYVEKGIEIKSLSGAQRAAFKAKTSSVEAQFVGDTNADGKKLLEMLQGNR
ncbi:MAG: TRAP-type C4-dicarboxylate transport system substrate-binding protein [Myxococcota bacterium]|jgi:TRAP-type C4-dicarboxylate transport system substrate-binding protein